MAGKEIGTAKRQRPAGAAPEGTGESARAAERPLRPSQCREYMRRVLAREFRGIVQGFVQEARSGSCQHVKLATELVTTPPRRQVRRKGTLATLIEEMERGSGSGLG